MKMTGKSLAKFYKMHDVRSAYYHGEGNWWWNLTEFPGVLFGPFGCVIFQTEEDYRHCGTYGSASALETLGFATRT